MTSALLVAALFAILGTALTVTSVACWVLWRRVRSPTSAAAAPPGFEPEKGAARPRAEVVRRLDELARSHRALEDRLARVEASTAGASIAITPHPGGPRVRRRSDRGASTAPGGPTLIAVPNLASPPSSTSEASAELDRRFGGVWAMADAGVPVDAIARESGYPIGQVELILGLRRGLLAAEAGSDA